MAGLIFIALLIGWFFVARWLARKITVHIANKALRWLSTALLVIVFMALPVLDEIIGGFQFRELCKQNAVLKIDAERIKGKTIQMITLPLNQVIPNTAIKISHSQTRYLDVMTNEELANSRRYEVFGGRLIRSLAGGNEMPSLLPMSNNGSTCGGMPNIVISSKYQFTFASTN